MGETFVLVHGSWHGGWAWEPVAWILREQGHRALAPTLLGVSDNIPMDQHALFRHEAARSPDGTVMPPWEVFRDSFMQDASDEDARSVYERLVPQTYRTYEDVLDLGDFYASDVPRSYIAVEDDAALPPGSWHPSMSTRLGNFRLVTMGGSHEVMFTRPSELSAKIVEASRD